MPKIEDTQLENIRKAAELMADSIEADRWVHTFGCGHATILSKKCIHGLVALLDFIQW